MQDVAFKIYFCGCLLQCLHLPLRRISNLSYDQFVLYDPHSSRPSYPLHKTLDITCVSTYEADQCLALPRNSLPAGCHRVTGRGNNTSSY